MPSEASSHGFTLRLWPSPGPGWSHCVRPTRGCREGETICGGAGGWEEGVCTSPSPDLPWAEVSPSAPWPEGLSPRSPSLSEGALKSCMRSRQRRAQLAREACSSSSWLWAQLSTGDGGSPPSLSHGVIFGSPSRLALPRPRELTGSKKAPRQSRKAESWHVPFTKKCPSLVMRARASWMGRGGKPSRYISEEAGLQAQHPQLGGP